VVGSGGIDLGSARYAIDQDLRMTYQRLLASATTIITFTLTSFIDQLQSATLSAQISELLFTKATPSGQPSDAFDEKTGKALGETAVERVVERFVKEDVEVKLKVIVGKVRIYLGGEVGSFSPSSTSLSGSGSPPSLESLADPSGMASPPSMSSAGISGASSGGASGNSMGGNTNTTATTNERLLLRYLVDRICDEYMEFGRVVRREASRVRAQVQAPSSGVSGSGVDGSAGGDGEGVVVDGLRSVEEVRGLVLSVVLGDQ
jgi:hypothetical protein